MHPLLPAKAFLPAPGKLAILLINWTILILGWAIASYLDRWNLYLLWLYLPLTIVMGNSVIVLLFSSHDSIYTNHMLCQMTSVNDPLIKAL